MSVEMSKNLDTMAARHQLAIADAVRAERAWLAGRASTGAVSLVRAPRVHAVLYRTLGNDVGVMRVVRTRKGRPSWAECRAAIPGYVTGQWLGYTS